MQTKKVEVLSPVGSFESLQAAIRGGADAIYFGVEQLNMRAKSVNMLTVEDLAEVNRICKEHQVKNYLTLNTVMYDHDMQLVKSIIQEAQAQGTDAVIASDFAVIELCNRLNMPLHISTQANVSNIEAVTFFSRFSDVIVLARELTMTQIENITKEIVRRDLRGISGELIRIETFVHGALCMAVSGKCYMSLHEQNASANRGACTQNCRRPYKVTDLETGNEMVIDNEYIMSPKDLCTIEILDQVINAGVDVLKIEGRGKSADYVFTTTKCYKEAVEAVADGTFTAERAAEWMKELETVYNRGFWEGYYLGRKLGEWTPNPGNAATVKKVYVAKGVRYYPNAGVGEFVVESGKMKKGDQIMIMGPNYGMVKVELDDFRVNGNDAEEAQKGDHVTFTIAEKISKSDKLYKLV